MVRTVKYVLSAPSEGFRDETLEGGQQERALSITAGVLGMTCRGEVPHLMAYPWF